MFFVCIFVLWVQEKRNIYFTKKKEEKKNEKKVVFGI